MQCALGEEGEARMQDGDQASQFRGVVQGSGLAVRMTTLASILNQCGLDRVDLLKMDIEGGRVSELAGHLSRRFAADSENLSGVSSQLRRSASF
jgi:FkbM family methyltransferase